MSGIGAVPAVLRDSDAGVGSPMRAANPESFRGQQPMPLFFDRAANFAEMLSERITGALVSLS